MPTNLWSLVPLSLLIQYCLTILVVACNYYYKRLSQSYKNYSSFLGMFDATLVDQRGPEGVTTHFKVVPGLCSRDGYLDLGVILALFDEVSSWAFIGTDRQLRPGVR